MRQIHEDGARSPVSFHRTTHFHVACAIALLFVGAALCAGLQHNYFDFTQYERMARGVQAGVHEPFASRVLAPQLAKMLAWVVDIQAVTALAVVGALSFFVLVAVGVQSLRRQDLTPVESLYVVAVPYLVVPVQYVWLPDALALALCVAFFSLWIDRSSRGATIAACAMCALAIAARMTFAVPTLLLCASFAVAKQWRRVAVGVLGVVLGLALVKLLRAGAGANVHGMAGPFYLVLKFPANFITNVLGTNLYTNTVQWCSQPVRVFDVSALHFLGKIREVGYCAPDLARVFHTAVLMCTAFGAWPFLAAVILRRRRLETQLEYTLVCMLVLFWCMAPFLGRTVERLFVYGFPLLVAAAPALVRAARAAGWWAQFRLATTALQIAGLVYVLALPHLYPRSPLPADEAEQRPEVSLPR